MDSYSGDFGLGGCEGHVALWRGPDGVWGDVTLPSAEKIPIRFESGEPISRLLKAVKPVGVVADLVMMRSIPETLSSEARGLAVQAWREFLEQSGEP